MAWLEILWSSVTGVVVVLVLILLILSRFDHVDPKEPPLARAQIPFIGHLIGMLRYHIMYFELLRYVRLQQEEQVRIFIIYFLVMSLNPC